MEEGGKIIVLIIAQRLCGEMHARVVVEFYQQFNPITCAVLAGIAGLYYVNK